MIRFKKKSMVKEFYVKIGKITYDWILGLELEIGFNMRIQSKLL